MEGQDISGPLDFGSILHYICLNLKLLKCEQNYMELFTECSSGLKLIDVSDILIITDRLEKRLEKILSVYTFYEMFFFSRRIAPQNVYQTPEIEIFFYRSISLLAFLKYCRRNENIRYGKDIVPASVFELQTNSYMLNEIFKDKISDIDIKARLPLLYVAKIINDYYEVEKISYYIQYLIKTHRTVCKGANLKTSLKFGICAVSTLELNSLTRNFDLRNIGGNFLSKIGGAATLEHGAKVDFSEGLLLLFQENLQWTKLPEQITFDINGQTITTTKDFVPNYLPVIISIKGFYHYARNFASSFTKYYKYTLEQFVVFIVLIGEASLMDGDDKSIGLIQKYQRAYKIIDIDELEKFCLHNFGRVLESLSYLEHTSAPDKHVYNMMLQSLSAADDIYLNTISTLNLVYKVNSKVIIVDLSHWHFALESILSPIIRNDQNKGSVFEQKVLEKIKDEFGLDLSFVTNKIVKDGKLKREIDIAFIHNRILIMIECKAIVFADLNFQGNMNSVNFRKDKLSKALIQADKTLDFVVKNFNSSFCDFVGKVDYIASIIVTPSVEYIWDHDQNNWITSTLPRIISIRELEELKTVDFCTDFVLRPFCRKL